MLTIAMTRTEDSTKVGILVTMIVDDGGPDAANADPHDHRSSDDHN